MEDKKMDAVKEQLAEKLVDEIATEQENAAPEVKDTRTKEQKLAMDQIEVQNAMIMYSLLTNYAGQIRQIKEYFVKKGEGFSFTQMIEEIDAKKSGLSRSTRDFAVALRNEEGVFNMLMMDNPYEVLSQNLQEIRQRPEVVEEAQRELAEMTESK